ncbi:hypothetical protein [Clostridium sp. UBA4395]|uniref:hypothetical protein n=1 Tax=Clostridium sp. UBA4395 TaxID=1946360 RepID=UPI0032178FCE
MFNWDEFRNGKVAVNCDAEEKAKEFVKECFGRNMGWSGGASRLNTMFEWYKEDTCYIYNFNNNNKLTWCRKSFFEDRDIKIIKWESEKMKFKVGDKVVLSSGCRWGDGSEYEIITSCNLNNGRSRYKLSGGSLYWFDHELKHYEPQTEFTFQEVVKMSDGQIYECTNKTYNIQTVKTRKSGEILITYANKGRQGIIIPYDCKFKLQEPKKKVNIYRVEHGKDRKQYEFIRKIDNQLILVNDMVECDTKYGRCYGKCVNIVPKELTEEEYKQYKECWRA